jgi:hypothetical protein
MINIHTTPDKVELKAALRNSFSEVVHAVNLMPNEIYATPIYFGKWSPEQHLGHLWLSTKPINQAMGMPKLILKAQFGTNNREEKTYDQLYWKYKNGLQQSQFKAPAKFEFSPSQQVQKKALISKFNDELQQLIKYTDNWSEQDLTKYILPHPALGKMSVREMLMFTDIHTRHHLEAINAVLRS